MIGRAATTPATSRWLVLEGRWEHGLQALPFCLWVATLGNWVDREHSQVETKAPNRGTTSRAHDGLDLNISAIDQLSFRQLDNTEFPVVGQFKLADT
jgi:hypothetical protein